MDKKELILMWLVNFGVTFTIFGCWLVLVKQFNLSVVILMSTFLSIIMTIFLTKYQVVKRDGKSSV